jgi:hypothetical protein
MNLMPAWAEEDKGAKEVERKILAEAQGAQRKKPLNSSCVLSVSA